jgi:hypothetical protein
MSIILPLALSFVLLGYAAYVNLELLMIDVDLFYGLCLQTMKTIYKNQTNYITQ